MVNRRIIRCNRRDHAERRRKIEKTLSSVAQCLLLLAKNSHCFIILVVWKGGYFTFGSEAWKETFGKACSTFSEKNDKRSEDVAINFFYKGTKVDDKQQLTGNTA